MSAPAVDASESQSGGLIVFLSGDLIFASRVRAAATASGYSFQLSGNLPAQTEKPIRFVILDLSTRSAAVEGLMQACEQHHPEARVIAYAPHVQIQRIRSARQHNIPTVLTRNQFNEQLHSLFGSG